MVKIEQRFQFFGLYVASYVLHDNLAISVIEQKNLLHTVGFHGVSHLEDEIRNSHRGRMYQLKPLFITCTGICVMKKSGASLVREHKTTLRKQIPFIVDICLGDAVDKWKHQR